MGTIPISTVVIEDRMRKEMGDVESLVTSIRDNGLIQPIVLAPVPHGHLLVAGHRRLQALQKIGVTELTHGEHFIWRQDLSDDEYRRTAVELEENIRRKQMTWVEECQGKQKLLEVYTKIYGAPKLGQPQKLVQQGLKPAGFGVRKLADLLNEAPSKTSEDLETAALLKAFPILAQEPSREAAKRKLELALRIQAGLAGPSLAKPLVYKILVECDSEAHQIALMEQFKGAGLRCSPIVA